MNAKHEQAKSIFLSAAEIARFEAERQALAVMDHPNIAEVFDAVVSAWQAIWMEVGGAVKGSLSVR